MDPAANAVGDKPGKIRRIAVPESLILEMRSVPYGLDTTWIEAGRGSPLL